MGKEKHKNKNQGKSYNFGRWQKKQTMAMSKNISRKSHLKIISKFKTEKKRKKKLHPGNEINAGKRKRR